MAAAAPVVVAAPNTLLVEFTDIIFFRFQIVIN